MDTVHVLVVPKLYTTSCRQGCSLIHTQTRNHKEKTDQDVTQSHPLHRTCFSRYQASSAVLGNHGNWEMLSHVIVVSNYTLQAVNTRHVPPPILGPVMIHSLWSPMSQLLQMNDPCLRLDTTGCAPPLTSNTASSTTSGLV